MAIFFVEMFFKALAKVNLRKFIVFMELNTKDLKSFVENLLLKSGKVAEKYYRKQAQFSIKSDRSLVTIADEEIEKLIRREVNKKFKNHNILGEEQGGELKKNQFNWVIDPIDGTSSFKAGRPIFTTLLALYKGFEPVFGAIYQPVTKELLLAIDSKLYFNGKPVKVQGAGKKITLATTSPDLFDKQGKAYWEKLKPQHKNTIYGGDAYNYMLLALGQIDAIYEQGLKKHDFLPLIPILKAANAKLTDLKGQEIKADYNGKEFLVRR